MRKLIMLLIGMNIIAMSIHGQSMYSLKGRILDEQNQPLPGASVFITPIQKGGITDAKGYYFIDDLKKGLSGIKISFIGYKTLVDTIEITQGMVYNARMTPSSLSLQEVVIIDHYAETRKKEESLNIEIINNDYLKQNMGGSLMKSLERLPGVSTIGIGSGQSKPVIRGLGFNRVVVVENGIKHEGQQWGADHGLEIDQYAIGGIEVIKGPASLMYGSDAIGGVIDIKQNKIPHNNTIGGTVDLIGKSNNNLLGTSILLSGRKNCLFMSLRGTFIDYADYKVPTDSVDIYSYKAALHNKQVRNTAGGEKNIHFTLGIIRNQFSSKFFVSNVNSKSGFFANAHGLEPRNVDYELHDKSSRDILYPYQQVNHFKLSNKSYWRQEKFKIETDFGFQRNFRQEWSQYVNHGYMPATFPATLTFPADLERQFDKFIYSGNLKTTFFLSEKTIFSMGINAGYQDNRIDGRGFIIPAFTQTTIGGYVFAKHSFSQKSIVQFGIRYDYGNIQTRSYYDWFSSSGETNTSNSYLQRSAELSRNFSNLSWSVGYNYKLKNLALKINAGKSFRMPIAKELAANGVNYHYFSYEIGNPDLSPEISYQLDAGLEYSLKNFVVGATPFLNYFSNYLYLNPGFEHDRLYGNGNQVYYYTESEVFRYGGEIHAHYQIAKSLKFGVIGEYVYSEQLSGKKKGYTLPFSPPASALLSVKYQRSKLKFVENAYVFLDYKLIAPQTNIVPPEEITQGYQLVNLGLGGEIRMKNQLINFSLQVQNLFNTKYFNHTSYYRLINLPESGRNFILNISIPFSGKFKQEK